MYTCGPTVYDPAHVGNFRTFLFNDLMRRSLRLQGWKVIQVQNLTRFEELSLPRFGAWGAVSGLLIGGLALGAGAAPGVSPLWLRAAAILGPVALLNAVSAWGTLTLARRAATPKALEAGPGPVEGDIAAGAPRKRLGGS